MKIRPICFIFYLMDWAWFSNVVVPNVRNMYAYLFFPCRCLLWFLQALKRCVLISFSLSEPLSIGVLISFSLSEAMKRCVLISFSLSEALKICVLISFLLSEPLEIGVLISFSLPDEISQHRKTLRFHCVTKKWSKSRFLKSRKKCNDWRIVHSGSDLLTFWFKLDF